MPESTNNYTPEISATAPATTLCSSMTPVGTTGSSGTMPENSPHRAGGSRGTSATNRLPPAERLPSAEGLPPAETTTNKKTPPADVNGGHHLHHQLRPTLRYGSELQTSIRIGHSVRPVRLPTRFLPGCRQRTDYTLYAKNGTTNPTYGLTSRSMFKDYAATSRAVS